MHPSCRAGCKAAGGEWRRIRGGGLGRRETRPRPARGCPGEEAKTGPEATANGRLWSPRYMHVRAGGSRTVQTGAIRSIPRTPHVQKHKPNIQQTNAFFWTSPRSRARSLVSWTQTCSPAMAAKTFELRSVDNGVRGRLALVTGSTWAGPEPRLGDDDC